MRFGSVLFGSVRIPKLRYSVYSVFTRFGRTLVTTSSFLLVCKARKSDIWLTYQVWYAKDINWWGTFCNTLWKHDLLSLLFLYTIHIVYCSAVYVLYYYVYDTFNLPLSRYYLWCTIVLHITYVCVLCRYQLNIHTIYIKCSCI